MRPQTFKKISTYLSTIFFLAFMAGCIKQNENGQSAPSNLNSLPTGSTIKQLLSPGGHGLGAVLNTGNFGGAPAFNAATIWPFLSQNKMSPTFAVQTPSELILKHPAAGDQGATGSCVSWSLGYTAKGSLDMTFGNTKADAGLRSGWFVYNLMHWIENDPADDGLDPTTTTPNVVHYGVASATAEPVLPNPIDLQPNVAELNSAATDIPANYAAINSAAGIIQALDLGLPVTFAFRFYEDFETAFNNHTVWSTLNSPQTAEGHQVCVIGYNWANSEFLLENQWGTAGGDLSYPGCVWVTTSVVNSLLANGQLEMFTIWNASNTTNNPSPIAAKINGNSSVTFTGGSGTPPYTSDLTITASPGQTVTVTLTQNSGTSSGTWYSSLYGNGTNSPLFSNGGGLSVTTQGSSGGNAVTGISSAQIIMQGTGSAVFSFYGFFGYTSNSYCKIAVQ